VEIASLRPLYAHVTGISKDRIAQKLALRVFLLSYYQHTTSPNFQFFRLFSKYISGCGMSGGVLWKVRNVCYKLASGFQDLEQSEEDSKLKEGKVNLHLM
jgi:hypothetical protein